MKKNRSFAALCLLLPGILFLVACQPRPETPDPSPKLQIVSISPDTIKEYQDTLEIRLAYEDSDGDLGTLSHETKSLWVKDSRLNEADLYHISPLAPIEAQIWIKGELSLFLPNLFILSNDSSEWAIFSIKIQDRAGNWSEMDVSEQVLIQR